MPGDSSIQQDKRPYIAKTKSVEWETPQHVFDELNREFGFTIDVAASEKNAKCPRYYTKEVDGLSWSWNDEIVWCNPPYGREIADWVKKAATTERATVVMLLPARTDVRWFHDYVYRQAGIRFIRGRLKFGSARENAPFPSMVVIFRNGEPYHD